MPTDGWALVVDGERRPLGWVARGTGTVYEDALVPGGSLYDAGAGSLRAALDAALSSPSGRGVAVDGDGRVLGSIGADDVLRGLADSREADGAPGADVGRPVTDTDAADRVG